MAIIAVGALLQVESNGKPRYPAPWKMYERVIAHYRKSTFSEEVEERTEEAKRSAEAGSAQINKRYHQLATEHRKDLIDTPSLANALLIESLPESVRDRIVADANSDVSWFDSAQRFSDRWLNGSPAGTTAVGTLLWFCDHPEEVNRIDSAILSHPLVGRLVRSGKTKEPGARADRIFSRAQTKASKRSLKQQGLTRKKLSTLAKQAELWAAVQVSGTPIAKVVEAKWFKKLFGVVSVSYVSKEIRTFDRAFEIVRRREPESDGSDESDRTPPSENISPTRW